MADAQASGACGSNIVWVQVPSPACEEGAVAISNSSFSVKKIPLSFYDRTTAENGVKSIFRNI